MITFSIGDMFEANVEAMVNPVNCVGVMGAGLALAFCYKYHHIGCEYKAACARGELCIGKVLVSKTLSETNPKYIIHFPTKYHWRNPSKLVDIDAGLVALREAIIANDIKSIAIPHIGCGLGKLNWSDVKQLIINRLSDLTSVDIQVICHPHTYHDPYERE